MVTKIPDFVKSFVRESSSRMGVQGVITLALFSVLKLVLDGVYAVLPDWDIDAQLATFNYTGDLDGSYIDNRPPWEMVLFWIGRFNTIFPIRETFQLIVFCATGYGFIWAFYYVWKFIKTLRGSG